MARQPEGPRPDDDPLTEEELRALNVEELEAREAMSTLLVAPTPGMITPQIVDVVDDGM